MIFRIALCALLGLGMCMGARAADTTELENRVDTLEQILQSRLDWSGELDAQMESDQRPPANYSTKQEAAVRLHLRPKLENINKRYSIITDLLFRADARNSGRDVVRIDEAYLNIRAPWSRRLTFRGGKIIYNWGVDALYNPTDFINPVDFYDFYHLDKLGVISIDGTYAFSSSTVLTVGIIPVFSPSLVSDPNSRWVNYSQFVSNAILSKLSLPATLPSDFYVDFDLAQRAPQFPQPFVRLAYKGADYDFSLAYSLRYRPTPQVVTFKSNLGFDAINSLPTGDIEGTPYYQQEHFFAADTTIPTMGGILFVAGTLGIPTTSQNDLPTTTTILSNYNSVGLTGLSYSDIEASKKTTYAEATIGFRKEWSKFLAFIQYARYFYLDSGGPPPTLFDKIGEATGVNPSDVFDFYSGTIIPGFRWNFAHKFWLRVGTLINTKNSGIITDSTADYEFMDGLKASLTYNYIEGKSGSLLQHYEDNSRLALNLHMVF